MQLSPLFSSLGTNPDGSGSGTGVAYFSTNSTGQLAFLDNMVAIDQVEYLRGRHQPFCRVGMEGWNASL